MEAATLLEKWPKTWTELFSLKLSDLVSHCHSPHESQVSNVDRYTQILKAYLSGNTSRLSDEIRLMKQLPILQPDFIPNLEFKCVIALAQAKLAIRKREIKVSNISEINSFIKLYLDQDVEHLLIPELYIVLGQLLESSEDFLKARNAFDESAKYFNRHRIYSKSCRARLNSIANLSRIDTNIDLCTEYLSLAAFADYHLETSTAAVCFVNLAREYQRRKLFSTALDFSEQAFKILSTEATNLHSALAQAGHADILLDLERYDEARRIIQSLAISNFPEVRESYKVLEMKLKKQIKSNIEERSILPTWRERMHTYLHSLLTPSKNLEQQVIALLQESPTDKFELIEKLYGKNDSFFVYENRLKNLLNRVRHRYPGCLSFQDSKYHWKNEKSLSA